MMKTKQTCASRIREALRLRDMTQAELCKITEIPKSAMSQYCNGGLLPRQNRIYLIAKALNVSEAWLMGFDVPMEETRVSEKDKNFNYLFELDSKNHEFKCAVDALSVVQSAADNGLAGEQELANALYFIFCGLYDVQKDIQQIIEQALEERRANEQINSIQQS